MREINLKVYSYDELSDEAKRVAIEKSRQSVGDDRSEYDSDDYRATLNKIEQKFGIKVNRWEVGLCSRPWFEFSFDDIHYDKGGECEDLLLRYLNREILPHVNNFKYYSKRRKSKASKVVLYPYGYSCCLTGCWCDNAVDDALNNMWDAVRRGDSCYDFVSNMLHDFFHNWQMDMEAVYEDDYVAEHISENEYEFYEDGTPFRG